LPARIEAIAALGRDHLRDVEVGPARALLRFDPDARTRLALIVAAEAECCAFLAMSLSDGPGAVTLAIEAPAAAEAVVHDLVTAFGSHAPAPASRLNDR
jgi:hypothetical protein